MQVIGGGSVLDGSANQALASLPGKVLNYLGLSPDASGTPGAAVSTIDSQGNRVVLHGERNSDASAEVAAPKAALPAVDQDAQKNSLQFL